MIQVGSKKIIWLMSLFLSLIITSTAAGADPSGDARQNLEKKSVQTTSPIVEDDWKHHKIGTLWNRVTNFSFLGDDAYNDRTPSCDYPGGSGNSYLYRGTLWLTARIDGDVHVTKGDDHEFAPLDSVHMITGEDAVSEEDTYTRYYDVKAPLATDHTPLGVEVIERTMAWSSSFAGDFIIYDYTIINVGVDTDDDGVPDSTRDLEEFYFTIRLDADVSKLATWDAEAAYSNQDDLAMSNGVPWDWIELFPQMAGREHGLTLEDVDSTLMFMFDGDNPAWPSEYEGDDDFGNPGADGKLQTPGFIGVKILKTEPYLPPGSFHVNHIYNDPATDQEAYDRMMGVHEFEDFTPVMNPSTGQPLPYDYRAILSFGPKDTLKAGDSLRVVTALGIGSDPDSGGVHSLVKLIEIMERAQLVMDVDFQLETLIDAPPAPVVEVEEWVVDGRVTGIKVIWDETPSLHQNFEAFKVWKSSGKTSAGAYDWQPLGLGTYTDTAGSASWPPPAGDQAGTYQVVHEGVLNGMDYYYSVQTISSEITEPIYAGVIETNKLDEASFKGISPSNPVASTLANVRVVPNPYRGSLSWNNPSPSDAFPWQHRLQFTNLPGDAKIKIFTVAGDFIAEVVAGSAVRQGGATTISPSLSVAEWDLMTRNNQEAAPGIYLYVVDSKSLGSKVGKFVIIR